MLERFLTLWMESFMDNTEERVQKFIDSDDWFEIPAISLGNLLVEFCLTLTPEDLDSATLISQKKDRYSGN
jgi:hypothetical protein